MSDSYEKRLQGHYSKLARSWGLQGQMSMQDKVVRERETQFIVQQTLACLRLQGIAPEAARILDVGCGNGHLLACLWEHVAGASLEGIEFVAELAQLANTRNLPGLLVKHADMRERSSYPAQADIIITERSVVNLLEWEWQKAAFTHIAATLRPGGHYIMVESFHEPWQEMNRARQECKLPEVPISAHNRYLKYPCLDTLADLGLRKLKGVEDTHALSTHFFLSRVFQHLFTETNGRPASERVWQFFSEGLPDNVGQYSPILFHVLEKDYQ